MAAADAVGCPEVVTLVTKLHRSRHHGVPRATKDVDIVPAPGAENLTRLWHALEEFDAEPQGLEDFRPREMPIEWGWTG